MGRRYHRLVFLGEMGEAKRGGGGCFHTEER